MSVLRRVPLAGWLLVAFVIYAGVQEWRIRHRDRALAKVQKSIEDAKLTDLAGERAAARHELEGLAVDVAQRKAEISGLRRQAVDLEVRLAAVNADLARQELVGRRLVDTGTVDEVLAAGRALGLHPERRPR